MKRRPLGLNKCTVGPTVCACHHTSIELVYRPTLTEVVCGEKEIEIGIQSWKKFLPGKI